MEQSFYSFLIQKTLSLEVTSKLVKMGFEIRMSVWVLPCKNLASRIRLSSSVKGMKYKLIRTPNSKLIPRVISENCSPDLFTELFHPSFTDYEFWSSDTLNPKIRGFESLVLMFLRRNVPCNLVKLISRFVRFWDCDYYFSTTLTK